MVRLEKILVPVDFSESSRQAVKYGLAIGKDRKAKVIFLHVINQRVVDAIHELSIKGYKGDFIEVMRKVTADREKELSQFIPEEWCEGIDVEFGISQGRPAQVIIEKAKELDVDLIVVGCQGHSALGSLLIGSVALYVVNHGPCPVLVVHPKEKDFVE